VRSGTPVLPEPVEPVREKCIHDAPVVRAAIVGGISYPNYEIATIRIFHESSIVDLISACSHRNWKKEVGENPTVYVRPGIAQGGRCLWRWGCC
jgi:hypothetical protein